MMPTRAPRSLLSAAAVVVAIACAFALGYATQGEAQSSGMRAEGAIALQNAFVNVYRTVSPSVVQIETRDGLGSGIVFDGKGDIVTNAHVVGSEKTFRVTTSAGKTLSARLVGVFAPNDLAVIRAAGAPRQAAFADSDALRVGDIALAI